MQPGNSSEQLPKNDNATGQQAGKDYIMSKYVMPIGAKIDENLEWIDASGLSQSELEGMTSMSAEDLIAYADAVPSWDYVEDGMWEFIAYWLDLDLGDYVWGDNGCFDPDAFLTAAKTALKARESC